MQLMIVVLILPADMKRDKYNIVLLFLCFCTGSLSNPVPEKVNDVQIHKYEGHIDTTTSASDENLARWTISANLHLMYQHSDPDYTILKLENIKTSVFNGNRSDLHNAHEKNIPEEAKILEQAFALKWDPNTDGSKKFSLFFKPNEPLWSVNLKRGVANLIVFEYEKPEVTPDGEIAPLKFPVDNTYEHLLYGECDVEYTRKSASVEDGIVYEKKMDSLKCKQQAIKHLTNAAKAPGIKDFFDILDYKQSKLLTLKKKDKHYFMYKMESKSSMSYKTSPSATYSQQVDQVHSLVFQDAHVYEKLIDVSEFSEKKEYLYEFGDEATAGRQVYEKDSAKLTKQFLKQYEEFNELFTYSPVDLDARSSRGLLNYMFVTLLYIDYEGFKSMEKIIGENKDFDYGYFYLSMLSHVGTNASVEYLTKFYKTDKIQANEHFSARMLLTFPQYLEKPSDEKLEEMEGLMNNPHPREKITKHAAVFGFASAVANACRKDAISKKYRQKYIDMFNKKYLDGEKYEEKMVYVLGLVNMAECLDFDFMNSITTNTSELSDLRTFALNGFKKYLANHYETADKVYEIYWPLVQKKSEPLEVRVAALELLLSSPLSEEQFNTIVKNYVDDLNDPEDRQLANYLLTSLHSIQNTTGYYEPLGALASNAIKNANIRRFPRTYATGKYRLSYTDSVPNVGAAVEARIVTDVQTNLFNTFEISFNSFGNSFDFGTYTLHLKLTGMFDRVFADRILKSLSQTPAPQILKLLKDHDFKLKEFIPEGHIDVVLYKNNAALYANHLSSFTSAAAEQLVSDLGEFILSSKYFTSPVNDYVHIPSDIGTPIIISNYMVDISKHGKEGPDGNNLKYRSLLYFDTWIQTYNPLADAYIESYKYYLDEKNIKLNFTVNKKFPPSLTWINEQDSYTQIWDNNMGLKVEEDDRLKKYCETCPLENKIKTTNNMAAWTNAWELFGVHFDVQTYSHEEGYRHGQVLTELWTTNLHRYNADALPYAGPFLYAANIFNYQFWLRSDLSKGSINSVSFNGFDQVSETTLNIEENGHNSNSFKGQGLTDIRSIITVKSPDDEVLSFANMTVISKWYPDIMYENSAKRSGNRVTFFNLVYKPLNVNNSFQICGDGDADFPAIIDDRLSIKPYANTVTETVFKYTKKVDDIGNCAPAEKVYIFKEKYSTNDKETKLSGKLAKDYEKCIADSKYLKYTASTKECKRVSKRFTEYDNYQLYWRAMKLDGDHNETIIDENLLIGYSRISDDILQLDLTGLNNVYEGTEEVINIDLYHPEMTVNPLWMSYSTDESARPDYAHSTCTITPSTIEKFNGKYIPNDRKEWFAFGGCVNASSSGLNGHTVDDKHIGFAYYIEDVVLDATYKNGHLDVRVNGDKITHTYMEDGVFLVVFFLGENVIYVQSPTVEIYYNTEYVFIRGDSLFPRQVCGLCN